jgi:hypothetical protein
MFQNGISDTEVGVVTDTQRKVQLNGWVSVFFLSYAIRYE